MNNQLPTLKMVKYLVCVDASKCALAAFHTALSMVKYPRDHLYVLSVMEDIKVIFSVNNVDDSRTCLLLLEEN